MPSATAPSTSRSRRAAVLALSALTVTGLSLSGCSGSSETTSSSSSPSGASASASGSAASASASSSLGASAATAPVRESAIGVKVTGNFGEKPALTVPTTAAPTTLKTEVLIAGTGKAVAKTDSLVGNYLGQTWKPKDGKPNIFDNSWDRKSLAAFQIGTGRVIKGWDDALVGQKVGSRVLLSIPAAQAYGATTSSSNPLAGQDLLFVVDIVDSLSTTASATGSVVALPAGYPKITNESGKQPAITAVTGVTAPTAAKSALLIEGTGAPIDASKQLALQIVQSDTATGKQTQGTWGQGAEVVSAAQVLEVANALTGKKIGSRAVALTPAANGNPSLIVIVDVIAQY